MSNPFVAEQTQEGTQLKPYSCLACRQRKVKCDRRDPCSNCTKSEKRCSFVPPVRGKRKVTKSRKEGLHAKVRRYEELLKSYGAPIESAEHEAENEDETSDVDVSIKPDVEMAESPKLDSGDLDNRAAPEEIRPKFVMRDGSSRYFERCVIISGSRLVFVVWWSSSIWQKNLHAALIWLSAFYPREYTRVFNWRSSNAVKTLSCIRPRDNIERL